MRLFSLTDSYTGKNAIIALLLEEISRLSSDYILNINVDDLVAHLVDKYRLEVPKLDFDAKEIVSEGEAGRGSFIVLSVPLEGSPELLAMQSTNYLSGSPDADIRDGALLITYIVTPDDRWRLGEMITQQQQVVETNLRHIAKDWGTFDEELTSRARLAIQQRRDKLVGDAQFVENLGIPIRRRTDMPATYPVPTVRKKAPVVRQPVAAPQPADHVAVRELWKGKPQSVGVVS